MKMIEHIAMVLHGKFGSQVGLNEAEMWVPIARAAIKAMRDPSDAMLAAGSAGHPALPYDPSTSLGLIIEAEWQAMIDAALNDS